MVGWVSSALRSKKDSRAMKLSNIAGIMKVEAEEEIFEGRYGFAM